MQLVFKLPKNKLPFLGIVFDNMGEAMRLNQELVESRKEADYKIKLEPVKDNTVNLLLFCYAPFIRCEYKNLDCDLQKMQQWLSQTRHCNAFNFSHLIKDLDREMVVHTIKQRKLWLLKLSGVELMWM